MTNNPTPNKKREIKLTIPPELEAVYANLAVMSTTRNEFIIDFAQMLPPDPRARVKSRVVMAPQQAKLLLTLMQRNLQRYEEQYGEITINVPTSLADELFRGIQPEMPSDDDDA
jgi:hypothetical protein